MIASKSRLLLRTVMIRGTRSMSSTGDMGSGSGKGGGSGGSIRDAGGAMGKREAAQEEMYFRKQGEEMKKKMKQHLADEIKKHEQEVKAKKELLKDLEK